jgi:hypothetical protein
MMMHRINSQKASDASLRAVNKYFSEKAEWEGDIYENDKDC